MSTISVNDASPLTSRFRTNFSTATKCYCFSASDISAITGQSGFSKLRVYMGQNSDGSFAPILCGVDSSGNDMLSVLRVGTEMCPPSCSNNNSLNS